MVMVGEGLFSETPGGAVSRRAMSFPGSPEAKESACKAGDLGSIPGSGRSPGEGNSNPLQYSCLGNPMDRGIWQPTIHGVSKEFDMT